MEVPQVSQTFLEETRKKGIDNSVLNCSLNATPLHFSDKIIGETERVGNKQVSGMKTSAALSLRRALNLRRADASQGLVWPTGYLQCNQTTCASYPPRCQITPGAVFYGSVFPVLCAHRKCLVFLFCTVSNG